MDVEFRMSLLVEFARNAVQIEQNKAALRTVKKLQELGIIKVKESGTLRLADLEAVIAEVLDSPSQKSTLEREIRILQRRQRNLVKEIHEDTDLLALAQEQADSVRILVPVDGREVEVFITYPTESSAGAMSAGGYQNILTPAALAYREGKFILEDAEGTCVEELKHRVMLRLNEEGIQDLVLVVWQGEVSPYFFYFYDRDYGNQVAVISGGTAPYNNWDDVQRHVEVALFRFVSNGEEFMSEVPCDLTVKGYLYPEIVWLENDLKNQIVGLWREKLAKANWRQWLTQRFKVWDELCNEIENTPRGFAYKLLNGEAYWREQLLADFRQRK